MSQKSSLLAIRTLPTPTSAAPDVSMAPPAPSWISTAVLHTLGMDMSKWVLTKILKDLYLNLWDFFSCISTLSSIEAPIQNASHYSSPALHIFLLSSARPLYAAAAPLPGAWPGALDIKESNHALTFLPIQDHNPVLSSNGKAIDSNILSYF